MKNDGKLMKALNLDIEESLSISAYRAASTNFQMGSWTLETANKMIQKYINKEEYEVCAGIRDAMNEYKNKIKH